VSELLDPAFMRELRVLERKLELVARSGRAGDRLARRRGSSAEFEQHRPYVAGDDVRRVDWLATARSGTPVLKQFRSEEDPIVHVLLDRSASLGTGTPPKLWLAKRLCAALAHLALAGGARLRLVSGPGSDIASVAFTPERRGRPALQALLRQLEEAAPGGATHVGKWVRAVAAVTDRPGLLVVVSDFLDPEPLLGELDLARARGHDIALVQVLSQQELEPELEGDLELFDLETNQHLELSMDPGVMNAYLVALSQWCERLRAWSKQRGQAYVRVTGEVELLPALRKLVLREQD
jgi:uncharacterized protein (DUF58 family)